jgi:cytidine deaminase
MNYFQQLETLLEHCHAPYSGFHVAAIAVTRGGDVYPGVNVESAAYSTTICAERNAIHSAVTAGARAGDISEVHILARNDAGQIIAASPCGSCRQAIAELSGNAAMVRVYTSASDWSIRRISDLLPDAFLSETLLSH